MKPRSQYSCYLVGYIHSRTLHLERLDVYSSPASSLSLVPSGLFAVDILNTHSYESYEQAYKNMIGTLAYLSYSPEWQDIFSSPSLKISPSLYTDLVTFFHLNMGLSPPPMSKVFLDQMKAYHF